MPESVLKDAVVQETAKFAEKRVSKGINAANGAVAMVLAKRAANKWKKTAIDRERDASVSKPVAPVRIRRDIDAEADQEFASDEEGPVRRSSGFNFSLGRRKSQDVGKSRVSHAVYPAATGRRKSTVLRSDSGRLEAGATGIQAPSVVAPNNAGESNDVGNDEDDEKGLSWWCLFRTYFLDIIEYGNFKKYVFDWIIICMTFYSVIMVPFNMAFPSFIGTLKIMRAFDAATDVLFVIDIYLNFRTAYLDEDRYEVKEHREIMRKYFYGWFPVDLFASLPFAYLANPSFGNNLNDVLPINKLARAARVTKKLDDMVLTGYARIVRLLGTFVVMAHVIACLFFTIGRMQDGESVTGGTWLEEYNLHGQPVTFQYISSLYWAFATLGTVGYGDLSASSVLERCFAIGTMFTGAIVYATIFGTFTNLIQEKDRNKILYNEKVAHIKEFARANELPKFIKDRLLRYHEASWQLRKVAADDILEGVPYTSQIELMVFLYMDMVTQVPIFAKCSKRFLEKVVMCFTQQCFLSGDYLMRQGDVGRELFFIIKGDIDVYAYKGAGDTSKMDFDEIVADSYFIVSRGPGAFIGEGALLYGERRGASVIAVTPLVQTLTLTKEAFESCINASPEVLETMKGVANLRDKEKKLKKEDNRKGSMRLRHSYKFNNDAEA